MLVAMATWEFIWRESCDWRLSHCKRLTGGDKKKKKSSSGRNEILLAVYLQEIPRDVL